MAASTTTDDSAGPFQTGLVQAALDRLEEGIAVFDAGLRLVYCNAPFRDLRSYPEAVCRAGAHVSDLYRYNARRGDYGDVDTEQAVASRVALAREPEPRAFDQRLADGTVLHVRYQPLPGAALLFSYEDVTAKRRVEGALASSQRRAAAVAEATTEGIYEWHVASGEFHPSPRLARIFGIEPGALSARDWDWNGRVHPDDFAAYRAALVASLKDDAVRYEAQYRVKARDGEYLWILDRGVVAERDAGGRAVRFIGAVLDISDKKCAEEALRVSQERFARAVESVSDGMYEWDIDSGEVYYSERVRDVLGLTPQQLATGDDWLERIHPQDRAEFRHRLLVHLKGESERFYCEFRYRRGDGGWGWARQHGLAVRGADGRARRMTGATGDITRQKEMAAEVESLRARLLDAIEALSEGFVLFDAEDRMVLCNSVYREYFHDLGDMVAPGTAFVDIVGAAVARGMFPGATGDEARFVEAVLARRSQARGAREQHMANGLWLQVSDHRTSEGGLVSLYTDITELKQRQAELTEAKEAAEQALDDLQLAQSNLVQAEKMAALGQLTAGVAHEIKNPLNFINNFAATSVELLGELQEVMEPVRESLSEGVRADVDDLVGTLRDDLATIRRHGERADGIVRGMLMHSRDDSGSHQPTDLNALIEESLNLAYHGQRAMTQGFNVTLERALDPELGWVDLAPQDIRRVFLNLLGNAFYAVRQRQDGGEPDYQPTVTVTTERMAPDRVRVRIRDNGTGMAPETLDKLFTPFYTTKPPGEGTGLGLSISHEVVVAQHGGAIRADSVPGAFTEFSVELPDAAQLAD
jgi:PAS domain S-box-containing protein